MKWVRAVQRWGSLVVAVSAVAGAGIAGKQWAQRHCLATFLGPHAESTGMDLYLHHQVACVKNVQVPLALTPDPEPLETAQLTSDQLWFSFETNEFLRKRLVLPAVSSKRTHIKTSPVSFATNKQQQAAESARIWLQQLQERTEALKKDSFVSGSQVCVDCDLLIEHWQEGFVSVLNRVQRLVDEAKDQQQQLLTINNPIREEKRISAIVQRLTQLNLECDGLISDLAKSDKPLREQQSKLREAMLQEKTAMITTGAAFVVPPADGLAQYILRNCIEQRTRQPVQYTHLLAQLLAQPFHQAHQGLGDNIRHAEIPQPDCSISAARLAGDIETAGSTAKFKATGRLAIMPTKTISSTLPCGDSAGWEFQIDEGEQHYHLKGRTLSARAGHSQVQLFAATESSAEGLSIQCAFNQTELRGSGEITLSDKTQTLGVLPTFVDSNTQLRVAELWNSYLSQNPRVPTKLQFQLSGKAHLLSVALQPSDCQWLAAGLAERASKQIEQHYQAAAHKLDQRVREKLDSMSYQIASAKEKTLLELRQSRQELELIKETSLRQVVEWAGGQFAQERFRETVR